MTGMYREHSTQRTVLYSALAVEREPWRVHLIWHTYPESISSCIECDLSGGGPPVVIIFFPPHQRYTNMVLSVQSPLDTVPDYYVHYRVLHRLCPASKMASHPESGANRTMADPSPFAQPNGLARSEFSLNQGNESRHTYGESTIAGRVNNPVKGLQSGSIIYP